MAQTIRSAANSKAHTEMAARGEHTTDDSKIAEKRIMTAALRVKALLEEQGHSVVFKTTLQYTDIKLNYHKETGSPFPDAEDARISIKPDGGVFIVDGKVAGMFEDKFEGTGDTPGKKKKDWKIGSTIDRTAKNLNMLKMYCAGSDVFPYVVFAHGCNFHPKLTNYKRLEGMNYCYPCKMIIVRPEKDYSGEFEEKILNTITRDSVKLHGAKELQVANIIIKTHAAYGPEALPHGASDFSIEEYAQVIMRTIKAVLDV